MAEIKEEVYLVAPVRTPIGKFGGALSSLTAPQLGAQAVAAALARSGVPKEAVDELIFGCARQAGVGPNVARQIAVRSGLAHEVPARIDEGRAAGHRPAQRQVHVETEAQPGVARPRDVVAGDAGRHQHRRARDDAVAAGGQDAGGHAGGETEIVGVDDEPPHRASVPSRTMRSTVAGVPWAGSVRSSSTPRRCSRRS